MIALMLWTLEASAHPGDDTDDDGEEDDAEFENCGLPAVTDPTTFTGARERCDGIDNDCDCPKDEEEQFVETDECVDEDGACVDEVMPCYQVEIQERKVPDEDPCLLESNPNPSQGCSSMGGSAFIVVGLLAFRRRD